MFNAIRRWFNSLFKPKPPKPNPQTTPTPAPVKEPEKVFVTLKKGDRGAYVKKLQTKLNQLNYECGNVDGVFGSLTEEALKEFQKVNGLSITGIAEEKTLKKLELFLYQEDRDEDEEEDDRRGNEEPLLWYPDRVKNHPASKLKMKTVGRYSKGYPKGAVVHFTAGRSRNKIEGGSRQAESHLEQGARSVKSAVDGNKYTYFLIARDGSVFQNFPLDRWGSHAGKSAWKGLGSSVSDELVGIEVMCAGRLDKVSEGIYKAWFTKTENGDKYFLEDEVRHVENNDNIQKGIYHKYSEAQEEALKKLLLWLEENGQGIFELDYVLGHDEVAGKKGIGYSRKNDPGGSLSMTMTEFRELLKKSKVK